jgi:acyl-[acyl-carrier-protein]-phospholipid O-acyltransferase/long-chain-fatty-acid--[acyl-carrier-protein] ligase
MIAWADYIGRWWVAWFCRAMGMIPLGQGRKSVVNCLRTAREALRRGELVCIFPEGGVSRDGQLQVFQPGFLSILKETSALVVPVYVDGLWGSIFSYAGGRLFWKRPRRLAHPVSVYFGRPIVGNVEPERVRQAVLELGVKAMELRKERWMTPPRRFLRMCRRNMRRVKLVDSVGMQLTGSTTLIGSLALRRLLRREILAPDETNVGLLLPPSCGAVLANAALMIDRRVPINLNYTASSKVLNACVEKAGIRHVLTSRRVLERFEKLKIDADVVYFEDLRGKITRADKLIAAAQTWLLPAAVLERFLGLVKIKPDDLMTIIFTSGSTGDPKGVMLSQRNIGFDVESFNTVVRLTRDDTLVGILPFFHSFGYTVTIWAGLMLDPRVVYHFNPLDARQVGELCRRYDATIIVSAPTFLRAYVRRCSPEDFASLNFLVTGAERLPPELADKFEERFGIRPVEGYGTTELSPAVAVNIPESRGVAGQRYGCKPGTVGRVLPGVQAKVVDLDTGADLGVGQRGMLLVKGPNVMLGYLDQPELTAEVIRDGWYVTGDVAEIDEEGFIRITDRESRFSKIGGEMVPHIRIEEALGKFVDPEAEGPMVAVTSVNDARKGERIVVLYVKLEKEPEQICKELHSSFGLPPLWIPSPDSFCQVEAIPVLGTGKVDLRALKQIAVEKFPDV